MAKKILFCFLVILSLSGCGKKQRFIERCTQNDVSYNICECMYTEVSQQIEDTDGFIEWFLTVNKKTPPSSIKKEETTEEIIREGIYARLLVNMVHCAVRDTVFFDKFERVTSKKDINSLAKTMDEVFDKL